MTGNLKFIVTYKERVHLGTYPQDDYHKDYDVYLEFNSESELKEWYIENTNKQYQKIINFKVYQAKEVSVKSEITIDLGLTDF